MPLKHITCAPGGHIGEQLTREFLMRELGPSNGIIMTNYHYPSGNGTLENDVVLINGRGVWVIEVKHWFGTIEGDEFYWLHNRRRHPSPITSVDGKAKAIASTVHAATVPEISVVGLVVLSSPGSDLRVKDPRTNRVFRLNNSLVSAVTGNQFRYRPGAPNLGGVMTQRVADALGQHKIDPERRIIGSYKLLDELEPGAGYRVYEAQHVNVANRKARIKQYHVPLINVVTSHELQEAVLRFQQDMEALSQVEGHPNIVRAYDFLPDPDVDDIYWLSLEWIAGTTLHDRLVNPEAIPLDEQLHIVRSLATALSACHGRGILHRNVNPNAIYLTGEGLVKLGDFDFARVPAVGRTISETGKPLTSNRYTAPELRTDARAATVQADLYGLGAVWYDMALRPPISEPIMLTRLDGANLTSDVKELLRSLLAVRPGERLANAADVIEWLHLL